MMPCGPKVGSRISGQCVSTSPAQRIKKKLGMIVTSSGTISADTKNASAPRRQTACAPAHSRRATR